ncbi:MAG: 5-(carboxyamino)imidazole ribonucleotide mutase [Candidatus Omnitrophica bacterium]|nr:5-(carboxyamino)imidazole ribonucleotide mutase [Candidatus Omnitrophota bacterium]
MIKRPLVSVIMGSDSDLPIMKGTTDTLDNFGIPHEIKVLSAHRSPEDVAVFAKRAGLRGIRVIIAGAGGAAHLAGVVASLTTLPVIGVPIETKYLKGIDSLFSTVQMPSGVPVASMSIGSSGAKNAGVLAAQILALSDKKIEKKLILHKRKLAEDVRKKNRKLKKR